jgi:hypothetical protein
MDTHTTKAISGAALAPLSNTQKRDLILLAKRAWNAWGAQRMAEGLEVMDFDTWRHQQQRMAVERASLTFCTNEDFLFLKAHYLSLLGKKDTANMLRVRAGCEPRIWAKSRFERECRDAADVLPDAREYAADFLRNARGVTLEDASEKQLWHAIYIIRRRASQLRRKPRHYAVNQEPRTRN